MGIKIILALILGMLSIGSFFMVEIVTKPRTKIALSIVSFAFVIAFVLVPWSYFSISTGEIGVIKVFGEAREVVTAGMHNKSWIYPRAKTSSNFFQSFRSRATLVGAKSEFLFAP